MNRVTISIIAGIIGVTIVVLAITMVAKSRTTAKAPAKIQQQGLEEADRALLEGEFLEAKKLYEEVVSQVSDTSKLEDIRKKLEDINMKILFSKVLDDGSSKYTVKPGDVLVKIAKDFNTTVELIKRANNLASDVIFPGQELKINTDKFAIVIDKSLNMLFLKKGEGVIKRYLVSTGKDNSSPVGNFKIINRLESPTWFKTGAVIPPDSSENILGSRWMGFDIKGYGIHGTTEPDKIGRQATLGCIRMANHDVEELYDIVPAGTEVDIVD